MGNDIRESSVPLSPLTEGRGLKYRLRNLLADHILSPLTEGRGLKYISFANKETHSGVAPHGGAWIEMGDASKSQMLRSRRPSRRGVD